MAAIDGPQPVSITLSEEELLVVMNTLEAISIPGLEANAWRALSPEQQDLALSVAQRGLQARGLAEVDEDGGLLVHRALLNAVGVCAYPHRTTLIEHWPFGSGSTVLYSHIRDEDSVVHRVARGLHTFTLFASEAALVEYLVSACEWKSDDDSSSFLELTVPPADFTRVCDASATGAEEEALQVLGNAGNGASKAGSALVHSLANAPRVSIVQLLRPDSGSGPGSEQTFTLIDGGERGWVISPTTLATDSPLKVRTVSRSEVGTALLRGLSR
jgi:hypothetical protein